MKEPNYELQTEHSRISPSLSQEVLGEERLPIPEQHMIKVRD